MGSRESCLESTRRNGSLNLRQDQFLPLNRLSNGYKAVRPVTRRSFCENGSGFSAKACALEACRSKLRRSDVSSGDPSGPRSQHCQFSHCGQLNYQYDGFASGEHCCESCADNYILQMSKIAGQQYQVLSISRPITMSIVITYANGGFLNLKGPPVMLDHPPHRRFPHLHGDGQMDPAPRRANATNGRLFRLVFWSCDLPSRRSLSGVDVTG